MAHSQTQLQQLFFRLAVNFSICSGINVPCHFSVIIWISSGFPVGGYRSHLLGFIRYPVGSL